MCRAQHFLPTLTFSSSPSSLSSPQILRRRLPIRANSTLRLDADVSSLAPFLHLSPQACISLLRPSPPPPVIPGCSRPSPAMSGPSSPLKPPHSFRARHEESLDRIASMGDASQLHSRRSSQQSNGSDGTSPDTPTFSTSCHTRNASTSSLSSSPPMEFESPTFQKPSLPQLPEVAEDVMDRDGSFEYRPAHSFGM